MPSRHYGGGNPGWQLWPGRSIFAGECAQLTGASLLFQQLDFIAKDIAKDLDRLGQKNVFAPFASFFDRQLAGQCSFVCLQAVFFHFRP